MNPKDKAYELVNAMLDGIKSYQTSMAMTMAISCAIKAVQEIKKECNGMVVDWWEEVESEINQMQ